MESVSRRVPLELQFASSLLTKVKLIILNIPLTSIKARTPLSTFSTSQEINVLILLNQTLGLLWEVGTFLPLFSVITLQVILVKAPRSLLLTGSPVKI